MWPWTRSWPARRREGDWGACMRSIVVRRETREGYVLRSSWTPRWHRALCVFADRTPHGCAQPLLAWQRAQ